MPVKVLPTAEAFEAFARLMVNRGFTPVTREEFLEKLGGMRLVPPKSRPRRESHTLAFRYEEPGEGGHLVWVWTTYMPALKRAAEHAAGWVLTVKGNSVRASSHPIPRTKNFFKTLLWFAVIAKWRIDHRPSCPLCGSPMEIAFGTELKVRQWRCRNRRAHAAVVWIDWDTGLPEAARLFEKGINRAHAKWVDRALASGLSPGSAIHKRKRWTKVEA